MTTPATSIEELANQEYKWGFVTEIEADSRSLEELEAMDFLTIVKEKLALVEMDPALLNRPVEIGRTPDIP